MRPFATSVRLSATWMKMRPRPRDGIRNVAIQNAFVLTCWRYSRLMMASSLAFMLTSAPRRWGPRGPTLNALDEDVLELGLRLDRRRKRHPAEIRVLDVFQRAVEDLLAAEKERDPLAEALGLLEDTRREDDRLSALLERGQEVLHEDDVDRVEAGEWLVQDQDLGVVHDRAEELHLLLHALAQLLGLLLEPGPEVHRGDPRREALHRALTVHALDRREEQELVDDLHLPVETALFGQVADALLQLVVHLLAEDADLARVRLHDVHDHPDGGRLPGAVRAEESERRPVRNLQVEAVDDSERAEALHDTPERDRGRDADFPPR